MGNLRFNILANFVGKASTGIMLLLFAPVYIDLLGMEAYGLVGLFTTLQIIFAVLDGGLSTALNREVARLSLDQNKVDETRSLVRTIEVAHWLIAGLIACSVILMAPFLSLYWLKHQTLSAVSVQQAVMVIGLVLACQFPFALYSGGLLGLQRHISLNVLIVVTEITRAVGAVLVMRFIEPTVNIFFSWQLCVTFLQTITSAILLWKALPSPDHKPRFEKALLLRVAKFSAGVAGISVLAAVITQVDKLVLSTLLPLEIFGYYTLASVVASALYMIMTPIFSSIFPRFSQLIAEGKQEQLRHLYHQACQWMSIFLFPIAITIALFSRELLLIWLRNSVISDNTWLIVSVLVIGTTLNGLVNVPYALQLANGWTSLALYQNAIAAILLIPLIIFAVPIYGAVGAAWVWVVLNALYVLIGIHIMHTSLLKGEKWHWYLHDIAAPLACALLIGISSRLLFPERLAILPSTLWIASTVALSLVSCASVTTGSRHWIRETIGNVAHRGIRAKREPNHPYHP